MQAVADTFLIGDVSIRRLGFGAMRLTGPGTWGEPRDRSEAKRVLRRAIKLGVNLIDTADAYGPGVSERLIAQAPPLPGESRDRDQGRSNPPGSLLVVHRLPAGESARGMRSQPQATPTRTDRPLPAAYRRSAGIAPAMVPIPGTSSIAHLEENLGANDLHLTSNELDALDSYRLAGVHTLRRQLRRWARPLAVPIAARILLLRFPRR